MMQTNNNEKASAIEIFQSSDGEICLDVRVSDETVWLTQAQMSELFQTDRTSIVRHIKNIYKSQELDEQSTCAKKSQVRREGKRDVVRTIPYYNLDMIISVGYRVNSRRGTQFRMWANKVLKDYLLKGYALNHRMELEHYHDLKQVVMILGSTLAAHSPLGQEESSGLFSVVTDYVYALDTLDNYDYQSLRIEKTTRDNRFKATYEGAMRAINGLKGRFGGDNPLFANEKDDSFKSSIGQIYQTFDGVELYPSVEEKAAMLLYLVVKNHSFTDGNKRIAATLFLWFMSENGILYDTDGRKRIADNALVALTLMIAESRMEEKDIMLRLTVNLINQNN